MNTNMRFLLVHLAIANVLLPVQPAVSEAIDFNDLPDGKFIFEAENWAGFRGFPGNGRPKAVVQAGRGINGSKALAVWHSEKFRTDSWGVRYQLPQAFSNGVVWVQCRFKPPGEWLGGFVMDARTTDGRGILARIAGGPYQTGKLRWHSTWSRAYWRLYSVTEPATDWQTITMRIDFDQSTAASWLNEEALSEEAPLAAKGAFALLHLGFGGTEQKPALIDDLLIGRQAPSGFGALQLLPKPEKDLRFRFAAIGDPQLGFGGYQTDQVRYGLAANQINRADAALTLVLGDMVHTNRDEQAYRDLVKLEKSFDKPVHYVRGNHEDLDLFKKHFHPESNYSFTHGGLRFVVVDAIGKQLGLAEKQLNWLESEFEAANQAGQEIVLSLHVSPWQDNEKGRGIYNQIGPGRDELRALMKKHHVLLSLSGHYHRGLWHEREEETHYLVLPGTARVSAGAFGWCLFDVYPDRVVMYQKPLFFGYEKAGAKRIQSPRSWLIYSDLKKKHPYVQQGPLVMRRHRPEVSR
ncbi:MAG: metallophosphoesterase family protein [Limisphaerales bacterium]